jgi:hypothetical protein
MILVTLFAVVVGPVNFYVLRRARRLYLLLLTVPAGTLLVTAGLILFALASDGVRVRLRVRSFADFDQHTGRAAVWSRQSYYAALAPSQGLAFPADTAVYPLVYEPGSSTSDRTTLLHWDVNQQQLRRGYLAPRTATQFMTCRATTSTARLHVTEPAENAKALQVENRLGTTIRYLVVRAKSGQFFAGEQIRDGQAGSASPLSTDEVYEALYAIARPVEPADPPADYNPRLQNDNLLTLIDGYRGHLPNSDSGFGDPLMVRSLLETNLGAYFNYVRQPQAGLGHLQPGSYLAVVETSPFVVSGIPHAREEASLHVVRAAY